MKIGKPIGENSIKDLERIKLLLQNLLMILTENNGENFISSIRSILVILNENDLPLTNRMDRAGTVYKDIMGGMGTLGDFFISHPNQELDKKLSKQLNDIKTELWELFGLDLSHLPDVEEGYPPGHPYWSIPDPKGEN